MNEPDTLSERLMLEEFGRCLTRVIESANNLTGQHLLSFFVTGSIARSANLPVFSLLRGRF